MEPFVAEYLVYLERTNNWLFHRLLDYTGNIQGRINISFLFNAYQPRANKQYKERRAKATPPDNPFFKNYHKAILSYGAEREETDNLVKVAVTDCYVPLLAASQLFPGSMSIAFPQITIDMMKNFYPEVYQRMIDQHNNGEFDLGISSYHHAFAPMIRSDLLEQEYMATLKEFQKIDKRKNDFITLHIPECAVSPTLLDVLSEVQNNKGIRFATVLDSEFHNTWPYPYDIGKPNELVYLAKGEVSRLRILFSNNYFSRKSFSFPPVLDPKGTAFWYFTTLFESIAKPQSYPYWDRLKKGENICFVVHTDAETIGFHSPGREYAFFLLLHLLNSFDFELTTIPRCVKKTPHMTKEKSPLLFKTWDMETHGLTNRWMKRGDPKSSAQFLFNALEVYPPLFKDLERKEESMDLRDKKRLWAARMRFANSLTSCPHWWSNQDSIPGKQFAHDVIECGRHIQKLERHVPKNRKHLLNEIEELKGHPFVKQTKIKV